MNKVISLQDYLTPVEKSVDLEQVTELSNKSLGVERAAIIKEIFPRIDPEFLCMIHPSKRRQHSTNNILYSISFDIIPPRFAVYTTESPVCKLEVELEQDNKGRIIPRTLRSGLPSIIQNNLLHAFRTEQVKRDPSYHEYGGEVFEFIAIFDGIIPDESRKIIKSAQRLFDNPMYIVAEAKNWDAKKVPQKDPLVIGVNDGNCYLVDQFNCTLREEYTWREFKI